MTSCPAGAIEWNAHLPLLSKRYLLLVVVLCLVLATAAEVGHGPLRSKSGREFVREFLASFFTTYSFSAQVFDGFKVGCCYVVLILMVMVMVMF